MSEKVSNKALRIACIVMSIIAAVIAAAAIYVSASSGLWLFVLACIPVILFPILYFASRKKSGTAVKSRAGWTALLIVSILFAVLFGLLSVMSTGSDAAIVSALLLSFVYSAADAAVAFSRLRSAKKSDK